MRVVCGWCHRPTPPERCDYCGHPPALPWLQRGLAVPAADHDAGAGRPALDGHEIRLAYDAARESLTMAGHEATVEAIAEKLDRSPRTVRAWKQRFAL
jgi:hypothetical protein